MNNIGEYSGQIELTLIEAKRILGLKIMAYKDYLAARTLYNTDLVHQASFFANTCLEKELKSYLETIGIKISIEHETDKIYNILYSKNSNLAQKINLDFLKALTKIYQSRYFEKLGTGYNFIILRNKFLAELDYTYSFLESLTRIKTKKKVFQTNYEIDVQQKNKILYKNNYLLNNISKDEFLKQQDLACEFRIMPNHEILEVIYFTNESSNDSKFIFHALEPIDKNTVQLSSLK